MNAFLTALLIALAVVISSAAQESIPLVPFYGNDLRKGVYEYHFSLSFARKYRVIAGILCGMCPYN